MLCICYWLLEYQRSSCNRATTSIEFPQSRYGVVRRKIMTRIHMSEVVPPNPPHATRPPPVTKCNTRNSSKSPSSKLRNRLKTSKGYITLRNEKLIQTPPTRLWRLRKKISPPMLIASKQRCERITWEALLYLCTVILGWQFMLHICDHSAACSSPGASVKHKWPCVVCRRHRSIAS